MSFIFANFNLYSLYGVEQAFKKFCIYRKRKGLRVLHFLILKLFSIYFNEKTLKHKIKSFAVYMGCSKTCDF